MPPLRPEKTGAHAAAERSSFYGQLSASRKTLPAQRLCRRSVFIPPRRTKATPGGREQGSFAADADGIRMDARFWLVRRIGTNSGTRVVDIVVVHVAVVVHVVRVVRVGSNRGARFQPCPRERQTALAATKSPFLSIVPILSTHHPSSTAKRFPSLLIHPRVSAITSPRSPEANACCFASRAPCSRERVRRQSSRRATDSARC